MDYVIETIDLTKSFGEVLAVDHVSFKVRKGKIFGFLGPNGAGKTTTVRLLTGVLRPDEGVAYVMNHNILKDTLKAKRSIGVVPEMSNAYIDLSAWNNLMLIGELNGVPKKEREERAVKLLREFGLYERRKQLVRGFSRGMKQKLLFCMALINDPELLFLDEPTSGLDVESARHIRELIQKYNTEGKTVFMSTHNMEEANQLCDCIAIINHGRIAAIDSPENLKIKSSSLRSVEVVFNKAVSAAKLSGIAGTVSVKKAGDKIRLYTDNPDMIIQGIVDFARSNKLRILSLNTLMPSLEDVFIELTRKHGEDN